MIWNIMFHGTKSVLDWCDWEIPLNNLSSVASDLVGSSLGTSKTEFRSLAPSTLNQCMCWKHFGFCFELSRPIMSCDSPVTYYSYQLRAGSPGFKFRQGRILHPLESTPVWDPSSWLHEGYLELSLRGTWQVYKISHSPRLVPKLSMRGTTNPPLQTFSYFSV